MRCRTSAKARSAKFDVRTYGRWRAGAAPPSAQRCWRGRNLGSVSSALLPRGKRCHERDEARGFFHLQV